MATKSDIALALEGINSSLKLMNLHLEQQSVYLRNLVEATEVEPHDLVFTPQELGTD